MDLLLCWMFAGLSMYNFSLLYDIHEPCPSCCKGKWCLLLNGGLCSSCTSHRKLKKEQHSVNNNNSTLSSSEYQLNKLLMLCLCKARNVTQRQTYTNTGHRIWHVTEYGVTPVVGCSGKSYIMLDSRYLNQGHVIPPSSRVPSHKYCILQLFCWLWNVSQPSCLLWTTAPLS